MIFKPRRIAPRVLGAASPLALIFFAIVLLFCLLQVLLQTRFINKIEKQEGEGHIEKKLISSAEAAERTPGAVHREPIVLNSLIEPNSRLLKSNDVGDNLERTSSTTAQLTEGNDKLSRELDEQESTKNDDNDGEPIIGKSSEVVDTMELLERQLAGCDWSKGVIPPLMEDASVPEPDQPWLTLIIPTVPRKLPYLAEVLEALAEQIPIGTKFIKVVVVHNKKETNPIHQVFQNEIIKRKGDNRFIFLEVVNTYPPVDGQRFEAPNVPGPIVRAQTRDLVHTIRTAINHFKKRPKYVLFMEDDVKLCRDGFKTIVYIIRRISNQWDDKGGWIVARFSYGFNGIILHSEDALLAADYLLQHQARRPPDHLLVEWFAGETPQSSEVKRGRPHTAYKYNLFHHLGRVSTLRPGRQGDYVQCWHLLTYPNNFHVEIFRPECNNGNPHEDIWPCPEEDRQRCPPWVRQLYPA